MSDKLLTITVPVYNTEEYLPKCLDSLIIDEYIDILEVLIVIDGSPDNSLTIAQEYAQRYPNTFIVINKENGGHSSAINKGLELATGKYFKLLDSDDWFNKDSFKVFLERLSNLDVDLILTNYTKEFIFENRTESYKLHSLPPNKLYDIKTIDRSFLSDRSLLEMHRTTFKTSFFKSLEIKLPERAFYTDTILAIIPMLLVKNIYYCNINLYCYFIGREGQSVSMNNYIKNREQLKRVLEYTYDKILTNEKNTEPILLNCILSKLRDLFNLYYIILSKLSYRQAKLELNKWNLFVKNTKYYHFFNNKNTITLYNLFPFFIFWNAIFFYRTIKMIIKH
ncbi:glycosyltransferase family 2 protein [Capnocytophaga gingivalis]|uniref:glycosyltransferase family 2 protein n=2 Tax=Capnocytophaga gingivalis TaxID=1017 RepID=UPI0028D2FD7A|nr:glycosyltransferase family 2 protein [Capnocytophaga gingivalis]